MNLNVEMVDKRLSNRGSLFVGNGTQQRIVNDHKGTEGRDRTGRENETASPEIRSIQKGKLYAD